MILVTTAGWCLIAGIALLLFSALGLGYVLYRRGMARRMTNQEVVDRMVRWDAYDQASYVAGRGWGKRLEARLDLNDLRRCAADGDWKLFWGFPVAFCGFGFGFALIVLAIAIRNDALSSALYPALVLILFGLIGPFAAWAALYTDIDCNASTPPREAWRRRPK